MKKELAFKKQLLGLCSFSDDLLQVLSSSHIALRYIKCLGLISRKPVKENLFAGAFPQV